MNHPQLFDSSDGDNPQSKATPPTSSTPHYGNLVMHFVDAAVAANGARPPQRITDHVGREAAKMVKEKIDPDVLRLALTMLAERGMNPSMLPGLVFEAQSRSGPKAKERDLIRELMEKHDGKWPTGARFVRGTHSGTYVADPLGYDVAPSTYGFSRPSRQDVIDALRSRNS